MKSLSASRQGGFGSQVRTFERHTGSSVQVEPLASGCADLLDVVTQCVAAVLPAVQADPPDKGLVVAARVGRALLVFVQQRVDEKMHGALMSTFHCLLKAYVKTET